VSAAGPTARGAMAEVELGVPSNAAHVVLFAVLWLFWCVVGDWGGRFVSAREAQRRFDLGARVALKHFRVPFFGHGVLVSCAGVFVMLAKAAVLLLLLGTAYGIQGGSRDRFTSLKALRYGLGAPDSTSAAARFRISVSLMNLCRRNADGRTTLYEMYDPSNELLSFNEDADTAGIGTRGICAEPGVAKDPRILYVNDLRPESAPEAPAAGDALPPLPLTGNVTAAVPDSKGLPLRQWGSVDERSDPGALICTLQNGTHCVYFGEANDANQRALIIIPTATGTVRSPGDVVLDEGFSFLAVNMTATRTGFPRRILQYLADLDKAGLVLPRSGEASEVLVVMDLVTRNPDARVARKSGKTDATVIQVWVFGILGLLAVLAAALLLCSCLLCARGPGAFSANEYKTVVTQLPTEDGRVTMAESDAGKGRAWYVTADSSGSKYISRSDAVRGNPRRFIAEPPGT
jgi:hypothetical protein